VRIGFYFYSHNNAASACGGTNPDVSSGWYVDEITLETGDEPDMTPFENFEIGWGGWQADYFGGRATDFAIWEIGTPTSGPGAAHEGTNCAATMLAGNYPDDRVSRLVSQPFMVPGAEQNPRLRFWHWWSFSCDDYGQVQISTNNEATWIPLATYAASSPWTRPQLDLTPYAGMNVRLGLYFYSHNNAASACGGTNPDVSSGWYVDEIRVLYDPAAYLLGSPVTRTNGSACITLAISLDSPAPGASFLIESPAGNLSDPVLTSEGCWSGTIVQQSSTQWLVTLQSTCTEVSTIGPEVIASICFTAISPHSTFVPLTIAALVVTNWATAHSYGTRAVNIANEPLMESWVDADGQRMATTYGKANTSYEICYSTNVNTPNPWPVGWSNTVPASLVIQTPVGGAMSNAPVLFLKAREQ